MAPPGGHKYVCSEFKLGNKLIRWDWNRGGWCENRTTILKKVVKYEGNKHIWGGDFFVFKESRVGLGFSFMLLKEEMKLHRSKHKPRPILLEVMVYLKQRIVFDDYFAEQPPPTEGSLHRNSHRWAGRASLCPCLLSVSIRSDRTWNPSMWPTRGVYGKTKAPLQQRYRPPPRPLIHNRKTDLRGD